MNAGKGKRVGLFALCLVFSLLFSGLGVWQVQRLAWKRDLIARVDARVHAPPVLPPPSRDWPAFDATSSEFARVEVRGIFRHDRETRVDALTERGAGIWLLTPLETTDGTILVNRGFVPAEQHEAPFRPEGEVTITRLLRPSEPEGRVLRPNEPRADRWFSRDISAIAAVRGIADVAPFFIDAEATPNQGDSPVGGLTVVQFRNAHLMYAATWFGLAALCVFGLVLLRREHDQAFAGR
ncbi:MAG: SURF1 family protein [Steroidobacteraceae bacterium]